MLSVQIRERVAVKIRPGLFWFLRFQMGQICLICRRLFLRRVVRADAIDPSLPLADGAARGNGEHILYIDDEERLANALKRLLTILGYRCTVYSDPVIAVNAFRANPQQFDAVIADVTMRGLSGIDVAKELRAIRPQIPLALTSGRTSQETLDLAASLGLNVWLSKPATVDKLCHTLDVLLQKSAVL